MELNWHFERGGGGRGQRGVQTRKPSVRGGGVHSMGIF